MPFAVKTFDNVVSTRACFRTNSNGEQMPSVESVFGRTRRKIDGQIREMLEIPLGDRLSAGLKFVDPLQLRQSNGCGEIGQIVFEAGGDNVIRPTRPDAAESVKGVTIEAVSAHRS